MFTNPPPPSTRWCGERIDFAVVIGIATLTHPSATTAPSPLIPSVVRGPDG